MTSRSTALLLAAVSSVALAAPPAPQPTAGANAIKQLRFDWNAVPGATGAYPTPPAVARRTARRFMRE